mmetsp:Transcript_86446/g.241911  ORF Transcript_86446/g.241911 Transcript_86446/m.241911 type:complete len:590 (+) Transcript_86446:120-1889(+)
MANASVTDIITTVAFRLLNATAEHIVHQSAEHGEVHGAGAEAEKENDGETTHERISKDLLCLVAFWIAIWLSGRLAGITRLSPLLYYLLFGCALGNLNLGALELERSYFLKTFSVFAISVVFFSLGLEENVRHFLDGIKKAWGIASIGAIVPFGVGFGCTSLFWPEMGTNVALMGGLAVTATAVSLTMIALKAEGLATSKPAIGIMTSAVLDDIASLAFVAVCVPIATGEGETTIFGICFIMGKAAGFFVLVVIGHCFIFPDNPEEGILAKIPGLRSYGVRNVMRYKDGDQAALISLLIGMIWGLIAILFGFHPAIGAYMAGLIMEEKYYDSPTGNNYHAVLHHIEVVAYSWLGPFFFLELGSVILIDMEILSATAGYTIIFFFALFIGQFVSAAGAAKFIPGGFTWAESALIGFGMMGRAELFFVVLELCYVQHDIMTREIVCTFAFTAMLMNISVPVCITAYKPYYLKWSGEVPATGAEGHAATDGHDAHGKAKEAATIEDKTYVCSKCKHEERFHDLDSIDLKIETPRGYEETSTNAGSQDGSETSPAPSKNSRNRPRLGLFPQVCGCMTADNGASYAPHEGHFNH